jgi:glutathione synthase/RimK-type ligase-like ATP-grasp enzyme
MTDSEARVAARETINALWGSLLCHPGRAAWINLPDAIACADYKVEQLCRAHQFGLKVPPSILTSERRYAEAFIDAHQRVIVKAAYEGFADVDGRQSVTWTSVVDRELLAGVTISPIPMIFQSAIEPKLDIRVTIVDELLWAASLEFVASQSRAKLDWRASPRVAKADKHDLDAVTCRRLIELTRSYGLRFATVDLVQGADGTYYFLELNAAGQWGWLEMEAGLPLRDGLIDALISKNGSV